MPIAGKTYTLLPCPGTNVRSPNRTGGKGLPPANTARPADPVYACAAVPPDRGRARAQEQEALQRERRAGDAKRAEDPGEGDRGGALHVVVETADAIAVALEETDRIIAGPVLELNERSGELGLDGSYEFIDESVELVVGNAGLLEPQIQRVRKQRLVVRPGVDEDGQRVLRRHASRRGVERKLANRDPHAVGPEVAEAENSLAARHDHAADVALRPVADDLAQTALALDREIEAARTAEKVAELLTGL